MKRVPGWVLEMLTSHLLAVHKLASSSTAFAGLDAEATQIDLTVCRPGFVRDLVAQGEMNAAYLQEGIGPLANELLSFCVPRADELVVGPASEAVDQWLEDYCNG